MMDNKHFFHIQFMSARYKNVNVLQIEFQSFFFELIQNIKMEQGDPSFTQNIDLAFVYKYQINANINKLQTLKNIIRLQMKVDKKLNWI